MQKLTLNEQNDDFYYYRRITDHDVNQIDRREGQILQFFTLPEIKSLTVSEPSNLFFDKNYSQIEALLNTY